VTSFMSKIFLASAKQHDKTTGVWQTPGNNQHSAFSRKQTIHSNTYVKSRSRDNIKLKAKGSTCAIE